MKKQLLSVTLVMSLVAITPIMMYTKTSDNSQDCSSDSKMKNQPKHHQSKQQAEQKHHQSKKRS